MFAHCLWRGFDIAVAAIVLAMVLPLLILLGLAVVITDPGPVFFVQRRIGYRGRHFNCFKFRSMKVNAEALLEAHLHASERARQEWETDRKLRADPRVTAVGALMRRLSLDEFPQLVNVLMGDMSIVGPRPIVAAEVPRYGRYFVSYCRVRPGLTGLWQTSGRNDTSYRRRIAMDVTYVSRKSLALDIWLLFRTVPAVLFSRGAY